MEVVFRVGKVELCSTDCDTDLCKAMSQLLPIIETLTYSGKTRISNSHQLNIYFDDCLLEALKKAGWLVQSQPKLKSFGGNSVGQQTADALISHSSMGKPIVLEIEKANKKTVWFDFIKLWLFIDNRQANSGIIICPFNYVHGHGIWNIFKEACEIKNYLKNVAHVPKMRLESIGIIGYEQMVNIRGKFSAWTDSEFEFIKSESRKHYSQSTKN
jgi:hypothetical protein